MQDILFCFVLFHWLFSKCSQLNSWMWNPGTWKTDCLHILFLSSRSMEYNKDSTKLSKYTVLLSFVEGYLFLTFGSGSLLSHGTCDFAAVGSGDILSHGHGTALESTIIPNWSQNHQFTKPFVMGNLSSTQSH
jgi:hypothetical protein